MKKNILILLYENDIFHCLKVAKELSKNYKINFFLVDTISAFSNVNYTKDIVLKSEIEYEVYEDLRDEIKEFNIVADKNLEIDWEFLSNFEKEIYPSKIVANLLKDFGINKIYNPRTYNHYPSNNLIVNKYAEMILKKISYVLNLKNYELIYTSNTSNFARNIILSLAKNKKIKFYCPILRSGNIISLRNFTDENYLKKIIEKKIDSNFFNEICSNYLENSKFFEKRESIYKLKYFLLDILRETKNFFGNFLSKNIETYNARFIKKRPNYFFIKSTFVVYLFLIKNTFKKFFLQKIFLKNLKLHKKIIDNFKFIYFPLHHLPEGGVFDYDELHMENFLIEQVAKNLPIDTFIVVKPHPDSFKYNLNFELQDLDFFKKISNIPNCIVISPHFNQNYLIKKCLTTVSVSGSAALESCFFKKNAFTFAKTEFTGLPNISIYEKDSFITNLKNQNFKNSEYYLNFLNKYGLIGDLNKIIYVNQSESENIEYDKKVRKLLSFIDI